MSVLISEEKLIGKYFLSSVGAHVLLVLVFLCTAYYKTSTTSFAPMIDVDVVDIEFTTTDQNVAPVKAPSLRQKAIAETKATPNLPQEIQSKDEDSLQTKNKTQDKAVATPQVAQKAIEGDGADQMNSEGSDGVAALQKIKISYDQYLVAYIRKYKTYPRIAERLKQQGTVSTKIVITNDGKLEDVTVAKSSGFSALDQGAINLIKSIAPFRPLPEHLKGKYEVSIPIEYILVGY